MSRTTMPFFGHGFFRQNRLNLSSFSFGARLCLASVSVDDVRDVMNVSSAEVPDAKVLKMIKRARDVPTLLKF